MPAKKKSPGTKKTNKNIRKDKLVTANKEMRNTDLFKSMLGDKNLSKSQKAIAIEHALAKRKEESRFRKIVSPLNKKKRATRTK